MVKKIIKTKKKVGGKKTAKEEGYEVAQQVLEDKKTHEVIAQVVGHRNMKIAGGLRVELDIPEANVEDIMKMLLFSTTQSYVKLRMEVYDPKKETKEKRKGFGHSK